MDFRVATSLEKELPLETSERGDNFGVADRDLVEGGVVSSEDWPLSSLAPAVVTVTRERGVAVVDAMLLRPLADWLMCRAGRAAICLQRGIDLSPQSAPRSARLSSGDDGKLPPTRLSSGGDGGPSASRKAK
mmetsp:Transcript_153071/g.264985  ORF Transcript_153071/g.264985 Transcript_153071/m.264985 type:complete len:132 (-) Transcript_153071:326-721(-)